MTPVEVNNTLPTLTKSTFFRQAQATEAINSNTCKLLVQGRTYVAPIGFTTKNDLKNAAKGIDEWVQMDGGNAYVLLNYKWVTVNDDGSTQLYVDFDTLLCSKN
ncbi:hypothetical protein [Xanthomarina sp. F2636L]|uniref:hypothetical protein n=1 Tax=Xanthomarina sp. F2636L TaxID=2996018 RepID=UPI00225E6448|nr:hypothetical protein [Xanthomarina sp. F2636L]MCX7550286.1 hypothetical protein [Xanthomarina sp. F2636L]